jgi:signal recognition particle receptor subunit beta
MRSQPAHVFKIVVTGPFAAGKTTFIQTVVDHDFLTTSASTSSTDESSVKHQTTVGMDFGSLTLDDPDGDIELRVYGTPGQERFSFMWEVLGAGADGYVLVVDGSDPASWEAARAHHGVMDGLGIPGLVAANRTDQATVGAAAAFFAPFGIPVWPCQANDADAVREVLVAALVEVLDALDEDPVPPTGSGSAVLELSADGRRTV